MNLKPVRILFFVDGFAPTSEDIVAAAELNAHVMFRNARHVPAEGCLEDCDGVAGVVPPRYAEKFPTAAKAIAKRAADLKKLAEKAGDDPAPVAKVKTQEAAKPAADAAKVDPAPAADPAKEVAPGDAKPAGKGWSAQ